MFRKTTCAALAGIMLLTGCMSDREYQLRKHQLENQAKYSPDYELFNVTGPFKLELGENGKAFVRVPSQPFQAIPIPDGVKTQADLARFLAGLTAAGVIGWKALDNAGGGTVMKNSGNTTNTNTTTTYGGCY